MPLTPEKKFGQILREVRKKSGLSQEQLGFESGYHRTYISLLERGQKSPSLKTIFQLAKALKVLPSDLLRRIEGGIDNIPKSDLKKGRNGR